MSAAILLVGSLVCALSDSLVPMLVGRALQGLAMGFIPVGISLMREITPPHVTATAIAAMSATLGVGGAIGLPLSAWIARRLRLARAVLDLGRPGRADPGRASSLLVPHVRDATGGRFDVVGAVGLAVGLVVVPGRRLQGAPSGAGATSARSAFIVGGVVVLLRAGASSSCADRAAGRPARRPPSCRCC